MLTSGESPSAVAWLQGYCFSSQYPSSIECLRLRVHSRTSSALYRSAERPRIAAQTICRMPRWRSALPHGRPHIAARLPSENLCGVSAEKGKFSVSRTVHNIVAQAEVTPVQWEVLLVSELIHAQINNLIVYTRVMRVAKWEWLHCHMMRIFIWFVMFKYLPPSHYE